MIIHILISIIFYLVLLWLSVNLFGLLIRGLFSNPELDRLELEGSEFIKDEVKKSKRADKWINVFALILIMVYLYLLFCFWNIGVVTAAIMIMVGKLPDLLWEIKHGEKITRNNASLLPHNALFYITTLLIIAALPVLYYSLYHF